MLEMKLREELKDQLRAAWHEFIDTTSPLRPNLHRFCLKLTGNVWDAEDLLQDALLKAFGHLGQIDDPIRNPKAYLIKVATNLWIDQSRRNMREAAGKLELEIQNSNSSQEPTTGTHDAVRQMFSLLNHRQVAVVTMKDILGMTISECAEALETTEGAVKSLLNRSRGKLMDVSVQRRQEPLVSPVLVQNFVDFFNAGDIDGLLSMVLDNATVGNVGTDIEWGHASHRGRFNWFNGAIGGHVSDWPSKFQFETQRAQMFEYEREALILIFRTRDGVEAMEAVVRLREEEGHIAQLKSYSFCTETKQYIGQALGINVRSSSYRYPTPLPGHRYDRK